ncbi:hypothetical protein [Paraburkholderia sp. MM5477-R1]|uniref:hypothetical protein n=1 Tax=Paraburkholderia sp. MM5477-R1 TaxID=2991062 RepID=UPI003D245ED4
MTKLVKTNAGRRKGTQPMYHQFSESSPSHLRLMAQLGNDVQEQMGKSQTHASLLHSTLRNAGNTHASSHAPANPQRVIQRSAVSDIDREAERKYGERMRALQRQRANRGDSRQDAEQLHRMSKARANGGVVSEEDDEEMVDGAPVSPCSLSKSMHVGAFSRLRAGLHSFMKAQSSDHTDDFATRYGMPTAHVAHVAEPVHVQRSAVAKPTIAALTKSIEATRQRVEKTLGISPMRRVAKEIATTAPLAKSLPTGPVRGLRMAAPQYSAEHVEGAAQMALAHGAIDAQSAQMIANSLALGGVGAVPSALMAKLRGE